MPNTAGNPFDHAFEMLGQAPDVATDSINAEALEKLTHALTSRAGERGRMVLLRSPRAGFGKTHLLMRLHQRVAHTHEFIPLEPSKGRYLNASEVLDAVLRRFSRILPAGGGLTVLDLLARRILAMGLEPLVRSGEVPSQDRESALQALQVRPVETFDFHNEEAVTARWAMANFGLLGPRLTAELAERTHAGFRPVAWWVELLFRYSSAALDQTTRNSSLFETVFSSESVETDMHEKLVTLLNLTGLVTSPVLVLDEVEGFSSNPEAALQVATFLNALHQSCNKLALIISVNGDVWETAFLPRLPCGLKDRLSDIVIDLRPMSREQAAELLGDRAGDNAQQILDNMDLDTGVIYARGLIREASEVWADLDLDSGMTQDDSAPAPGDHGHAPTPISLATPAVAPAVEMSETAPAATEVELPQSVSQEPGFTSEEISAPESAPAAPAHVEAPRVTSDVISAAAAAAAAEVPDVAEDDVFGALNHPGSPVSTQPLSPATSAQQASSFDDVAEASEPVVKAAEPEGLSYYEDAGPEPQTDLPQPFAHVEAAEPEQSVPQPPVTQQAEIQAEPSPFSFASEQPNLGAQPVQPPQAQPEPESPFTPVVEPAAVAPGSNPEPTAPQTISSPFAIDTEANPVSPFQPAETTQPAQPYAQTQAAQPAPTQGGAAPQPHAVTSEDQEKVEDLLRQFRDRYGRDE